MKPYLLPLTLVVSLTLSLNVSATVHYVDLNSTNPVVPYTNWLTAATNIQDAISFASSSDTVLVTNGVYQTGGGSSRVSLGTGRTLQSVNGPAFTTIKGYQVPGTTNGPGSVRCAYLSGGAMLSGFTLTNGSASGNAGGVYCESVSATISNCVIVGNAASGNGGAVYQGTFINCTLANNVLLSGGWGGAAYYSVLINCRLTGNLSSYRGGGAGFSYLTNCVLSGNRAGSFGGATDGSTLVNCTVTGNTAHEAGGGCSGDRLFNCIVYYNNIELPNTALSNYIASLNMTNCCTSPLPFYGTGNITNPPFFANPVGGDYHLNAASPCINAGINAFVTNVIDLDGNPRVVAGTVDMGAYEFPAPIHYVNLQNHAPVSPYTNWATAATGIQDAVDAATNSDLILVTNGIYQTGSRVVPIFDDSTPNRLAVTKAVTVQSVNGALATIIQGYRPSTGTGDNAIRCLYLTNGASLFGFTLTNGATHTIAYESPNGGGVYCPSTAAVLSNCVICGCNSGDLGGGAYRGTLYSCTLSRNHSSNGGASYSSTLSDCTLSLNEAYLNGGGADGSTLNNCTLNNNYAFVGSGGGVYACTLSNCTLSGNVSYSYGGGASGSTLNNCILTGNSAPAGGSSSGSTLDNCVLSGNSASSSGGGAWGSTLNNCTLWGNSAPNAGGAFGGTLRNCTLSGNSAGQIGGGVNASTVFNSILYNNTAPTNSNFNSATLNYCCTTPLPDGVDNITNAPLFVFAAGNNFHPQSNSPCINSGRNSYATNSTDLDGNPRISGGTVDIGAYEFQNPASVISYAWLQQYGLPTDGMADYADSDIPVGDGMNNWQEWQADTSPLDANDFLCITNFTRSGAYNTLWWTSKSTRLYRVERRATFDDTSAWETIITNAVPGWNNVGFDNTGPQSFYRIQAVWP